jgi:hypothetical protein
MGVMEGWGVKLFAEITSQFSRHYDTLVISDPATRRYIHYRTYLRYLSCRYKGCGSYSWYDPCPKHSCR